MLSVLFNSRFKSMAADELSVENKIHNAYKSMKNCGMRNIDSGSIDRFINLNIVSENKSEIEGSGDEDDEISVGCPSPVSDYSRTRNNVTSEDQEIGNRSSPCSSLSSTSPQTSGNHLDLFNYSMCEKMERLNEKGVRYESANDCNSSSDEDDSPESCRREGSEEYFKPLKKLKMMKIDKTSFSISERSKRDANKRLYRKMQVSNLKSRTEDRNAIDSVPAGPNAGVKSFSITDILSHKPSKNNTSSSPAKIVRPWDCGSPEDVASSYLLPPPAHRGIMPQASLFLSHFHHQHLAMHLHRPKSEDISSTYETCSSSGRSSTGGSDCCTSPDVLNCSIQNSNAQSRHQRLRQSEHQPNSARHKTNGSSSNKPANSSPLDALFQMTSKTFDELNGDSGTESNSHLNLFNNRQQPKKKRKSRTAFTNHQIFELERRFIYQKYLSPADRDEIAAQLGLSNAQVITWFQNRRAKMKRDIEEMKKDVESSKVLTQHNTFLENVQNLSTLKRKPTIHNHTECKKSEKDN